MDSVWASIRRTRLLRTRASNRFWNGAPIVAALLASLFLANACSRSSGPSPSALQFSMSPISIRLENLDRSMRIAYSTLIFAELLRDRQQPLRMVGETYTNDWSQSKALLPPLVTLRLTIVGWTNAERDARDKLERSPSRTELSEGFRLLAPSHPAPGESNPTPYSEKYVVFFEDQSVVPCILYEMLFEGVDHYGETPHVVVTCVAARVVDFSALHPEDTWKGPPQQAESPRE